jgi:hypothetical protein
MPDFLYDPPCDCLETFLCFLGPYHCSQGNRGEVRGDGRFCLPPMFMNLLALAKGEQARPLKFSFSGVHFY